MKAILAILTAFGALNWVALSMFEKDAITMTMGEGRTTGTDGVRIAVALAALGLLASAFKSGKKG